MSFLPESETIFRTKKNHLSRRRGSGAVQPGAPPRRNATMKKPIPVREFARPTFRPALEPLESRLTPSTYTVSSLADSGEDSLRAAITSVNADTAPDEIDFSVAGVI